MATINKFTGLRNQARPERLAPGSLTACQNVIVDDTGAIETRFGYFNPQGLNGISDGYCMPHERYGFALAAGSLYCWDGYMARTAATGLADTHLHFAAFGDHLFYAGDHDSGWVVEGVDWRPLRMPMPPTPTVEIAPGHLAAGQYQVTQVFHLYGSGIDSPAPASRSVEVPENSALIITAEPPPGYAAFVYATTCNGTVEKFLGISYGGAMAYDGQTLGDKLDDALVNTYTLPDAPVCGLAVCNQCLHAAFYNPSNDETSIYYSQRAHYQAYRLAREAYSVQGKVVQMLGVDEGILIATNQALWLWREDGSDAGAVACLNRYGCPDGRPMDRDSDGDCAINTYLGVATYPPYNEDGMRKFMPPDPDPAKHVGLDESQCSTSVLYQRGLYLAVVNQREGGEPYEQYD